MEKAIFVILFLASFGLLAAQTDSEQQVAAAQSETARAVATHVDPYPNLRMPELTAVDLASVLELNVVKGRLPNVDGMRISGYELFFRDAKGKLRALGNGRIRYSYTAMPGSDQPGEMLVVLGKGEKKGEMVVTLISRSKLMSMTTRYLIKVPNNEMGVCAHQFQGKTGGTVEDWMYVVQVGDNPIFSWGDDGASAELILRTYPEVAEPATADAP